MQSASERLSYRQRQDPDVLASTFVEDWNNLPAKTIGKVHKRWKKVLDLILRDNGANRYVEQERGKLTNDPTTS